ncbi:N-lysine methyltransferase KMT5A isoform X1 [Ovis aries]|uniref:Lysine methyltransferase 5A n=4 Tax=Ovis TaxID=9935 RepID=A0AC11DM58_SHEEP|nr:N-lysine methyltransferase KMT5A isoform X1 [Ovis aries]XP_060257086.1 N-lysine methyltransferase KMT5A isoform X1 [Ovis aries]
MPTETLREHRLGHTGGLSFTAARCAWHGRVSRNIRGARESGRPAGREPGLSLSCFPPLPPRVAEDAREGARPSWDSSRPRARPPSLPPSLRRSFSAPPLPAPSPAGSGRWAAAAAASGRAAEDAPPAPPSLRPRSRAGRGCRGARVPGPASQAMGEGGAVGRRRPFPGAPRRRWWRRQQQQQRQRQRWWPGRGGEGEGRAAMGLAGLQENVFTGQSKIYTYMSPNKCSGMRSPLQEENSVAQYEVKCQGKPLAGIYRKRDEKRNSGNAIRSSMKAEEQKIKDARRGPLAPFPNQKSEAAEPPKTPTSSCDTPNAAAAKQALKKPVKGKQAPRKKAQGKTQQNRKLTDFYPVRRSSRKSKAELQSEERKRIDELIESGKEEGMKIDLIDGKGRGVIATKQFSRGEFVVEYHGDLIEITDAKKREALYAQDPSTGCYMYYFQYLSKTYCVDATRETNRLGRLINHSKCGNCQTKLHDIDGVPHLILIASRDIEAGEELLYDYGDRSRASIEAYPWLKH